MTPNFTLFVVFSSIAIVGIALMVWNNDKIVVLEDCFYDWLCDRLGYIIAKAILIYRGYRIKRAKKNIDKAIRTLDKEKGIIEKIRGRKFNDRRSKQ